MSHCLVVSSFLTRGSSEHGSPANRCLFACRYMYTPTTFFCIPVWRRRHWPSRFYHHHPVNKLCFKASEFRMLIVYPPLFKSWRQSWDSLTLAPLGKVSHQFVRENLGYCEIPRLQNLLEWLNIRELWAVGAKSEPIEDGMDQTHNGNFNRW